MINFFKSLHLTKTSIFFLIITVIIICGGLFMPYFSLDEIEHLTMGYLVAQGLEPFIDFFEHHGTVLRYVLAVFFKLHFNIWGIMIIFKIMARIGTIFFSIKSYQRITTSDQDFFFFSRKLQNPIMMLILVNLSYSMVIMRAVSPDVLMMIFLLICFYLRLGSKKREQILAGIVALISILTLTKACMILPFIFFLTLKNNEWKRGKIARKIGRTALGFFGCAAVYFTYLFSTHTLGEIKIIYRSIFGINEIIQSSPQPFFIYLWQNCVGNPGFAGGLLFMFWLLLFTKSYRVGVLLVTRLIFIFGALSLKGMIPVSISKMLYPFLTFVVLVVSRKENWKTSLILLCFSGLMGMYILHAYIVYPKTTYPIVDQFASIFYQQYPTNSIFLNQSVSTISTKTKNYMVRTIPAYAGEEYEKILNTKSYGPYFLNILAESTPTSGIVYGTLTFKNCEPMLLTGNSYDAVLSQRHDFNIFSCRRKL